MSCCLDLENLNLDERKELILFATHDFMIYRHRNYLKLGSCDDELLSELALAVDFTKFSAVDLNDAVVFLFTGTDMAIIDKDGLQPIHHKLDPVKIGQVITPIFPSEDTDCVIFGTKQANRVQFVTYNFMEQKRSCQTAFWNVSRVTDIRVDTSSEILYAVLDYSTIVACDMTTGETLWTKFETATVSKGLLLHEGKLLYSCQGLLKQTNGKQTETIRIPILSVSSLEHNSDRCVYFSTNDTKNLACYDLQASMLLWEVYGRQPILNSIPAKSKNGISILVLQTEDYLALINLSSGQAEKHIRTTNISRIVETGDHILVFKQTGTTALLPGTVGGI